MYRVTDIRIGGGSGAEREGVARAPSLSLKGTHDDDPHFCINYCAANTVTDRLATFLLECISVLCKPPTQINVVKVHATL